MSKESSTSPKQHEPIQIAHEVHTRTLETNLDTTFTMDAEGTVVISSVTRSGTTNRIQMDKDMVRAFREFVDNNP